MKKIAILFLTFLILFIIVFLNLDKVKENLPYSFRSKLKTMIGNNFFKTELARLEMQSVYIAKLEKLRYRSVDLKEIEDTIKTYGLIFFGYQSEIINIDSEKYTLKKYKTFQLINGIDPEVAFGSSFVDYYEDRLFLATADGKITFTENLNSKNLVFKYIDSNFRQLINDEEFYYYNVLSIKDLFIFQNKIYLSYSNEQKEDCYNTSILVADLNLKFLKFKNFFEPTECISKNNIDNEFNFAQSGGRIFNYKNQKLLFTTGDYRFRENAQKLDSTFGKILSLDINTGQFNIVSYGHRNPQGLFYDKERNFIILTEHGPMGGDEINLNISPEKKIKNYGWPVASYGEHYSILKGKNNPINKEKYKKYPLLKSHSKNGFEEPIKYYVPSVAISQIIKIGDVKKNVFLVTSLKAKTIFIIELDENFKLISEKKFYIGERVRDAITTPGNKKIILFLENSPSLAILEK